MQSHLRFRYEFDADGDAFGWLAVDVATPDFSGRNGMWVQWQDVVEFAERLRAYPIPVDEPVECEWGWSEGGSYQLITRVAVASASRRGGVSVRVDLADYDDPVRRCSTGFSTDYPAVARFSDELERLMRREAEAATLLGTS